MTEPKSEWDLRPWRRQDRKQASDQLLLRWYTMRFNAGVMAAIKEELAARGLV